MTELYSQYASGLQFTAGTIVGSATGISGINPIVDRINSLSSQDNLITGSMVSGTSTNIITPYQDGNSWTGSMVSGTSLKIYASVLSPKSHDSAYGSSNGTQTTQSTSFVDFSGASATLTTDGSKVLITTSFVCKVGTSNNSVGIRLSRDNETAVSSNATQQYMFDTANQPIGGAITWMDTPSAAAHTYELQFRSLAGGIDVTTQNVSIATVELKNSE